MPAQFHAVKVPMVGLLAVVVALACGGDGPSGPGDTTIQLELDPVTSPTNQPNQTISGSTDASAVVTITTPVDSMVDTASASGAFSANLSLSLNSSNSVSVRAVDPAGNAATRTATILHDNIAPTLSITAPTLTAGQSGFDISFSMSDESSGLDQASLQVSNDGTIGGVFGQDGNFSTTFAAGTNLVTLFNVTGTGGSLTVDDSLAFPAGANELSGGVSDLAGNASTTALEPFTVTADPDRFIVVNSSGSVGSSGNNVVIGFAHADSIRGVQFDLTYDPAVIASVDLVTVGARASSFDGTGFNEIAPGQVRVLLFDTGGDAIPGGQGPILTISVSVDAAAPAGDATLTLGSILVSDSSGTPVSVPDATGTFTVS